MSIKEFPKTDKKFFDLISNRDDFYNFLDRNKLIEPERVCNNSDCQNKKDNIRFCLVKGQPK